MVQLARQVGAPVPTRQLRVFNRFGEFEARLDLCWPEIGLFCELDGQHHPGQPVYDANRQTRVVAATGWLPGRFTWREVRYNPIPTGRRLLGLIAQAERRPLLRAPIGVN
jgi:very-short-patch-repair endonuclease